MDFDLCVKLKAAGFPQYNIWEIRRPNLDVMMTQVKIESAAWGATCVVTGGGTKAEGKDFLTALGILWLNQHPIK